MRIFATMPETDPSPEPVTHFFGASLRGSAVTSISLSRSELHLTSAALAAGATTTGTLLLRVATDRLPTPLVVCTLDAASPHALLDITFFSGDGAARLSLVDDKGRPADPGAAVDVTGSAAVFPLPDVDDDDEEDDDDNEEDENESADEDEEEEEEEEEEEDDDEEEQEKAPAPAASATDKLKRKRDEASAVASAVAVPAKQARIEASAPVPAKPAPVPVKAALPPAPALAPAPSPASSSLISLADGKVRYLTKAVGRPDGPVASKGKRVTVSYVGRLGSNQKVFDKSGPAGFSFKLGAGEVIKGWDIGVAGMRIGTKRQLILHPSVAYGSRGAPPDIPPHATLIFDVELLRA